MADETTDHSGISPAKRGPASDILMTLAARLVRRRDDDASDGYARLALRRGALAALIVTRYGA